MSRRILLVDDDIAEISAVKRVLGRAGLQAVLATSAADALAAIAQATPSLVLVASGCEGGYALSVTHRLADDAATAGVPVIVLGETDAASDAATQLPQPVDPAQLAERVQALLDGGAAPNRAAPRNAAEPSRRAAPGAPEPAPIPPRTVAQATRRAPAARAPAAATPAADPPAPAPARASPERRAAAEALRARAEELRRRAPPPPAVDPSPAPAEDPDGAGGLDEVLRRAEEAERAHAARARAAVRAASRPDLPPRREPELDSDPGPDPSPPANGSPANGARRDIEAELADARERLEAERSRHGRELEQVRQRAAAEERANEEIRRMAQEEAEEALRGAIASARSEMEALRRRTDEEARRRARAEAEVARLGDDAGRLAAARAALADPPPPSPEEQALRAHVHALRDGRGGGRRAAAYDPPSWLEPSAAPAPEVGATPVEAAPPPPPPAEELRAGDLADVPAPRLLARAARARLSGRLDFAGAAARSLWLEDGRVVGATSAAPTERVEEIAVRLGLVTREQYRQVVGAASTLPTRRAAVLLLERGFLKPTELTPLVRRRTEEVVFGLFAEPGGRFSWAADAVPGDERIALERGTLALAVEGVRRRWLADRVDAVLGGPATLLAPAQGGPPPDALALSPEERRAVALADGLRALDEVIAASPLDPLTTRQVLAALVLVGALAIRVHQAGRPSSAAAAAIDLARVREKLDQIRRADYFTILGVGRLCTPHEVRDAAERLGAEYDPRRFAGAKEEGLAEKVEEILRVVADAREVLADDRLREEYLRGLGG